MEALPFEDDVFPEACDLTAMKHALAPYLPPPAPTPPLWEPGVLDQMAREAGLEPSHAFDLTSAYEYPDDEALARAMLSPGNVAVALQSAEEAALSAAIVEALAPFRTATGGYRLENEWRFLIASA